MAASGARGARDWLRRQQLRTRILAGVLLVTLAALVAFDVAAVTALRGYLLSQSDAQLRNVLGLVGQVRVPPGSFLGRPRPAPNQGRRKVVQLRSRAGGRGFVVTGPDLLVPRVLGQYFVATLSGHRSTAFVRGNPDLVPRLPAAGLASLAATHRAATVSSVTGRAQLRLLAEPLPGGSVVYATTSLGEVDRTVGRLELILVIGSAVAGLLAAGGAAWVVRRGLRPIEAMATEADRISAGDLADRVSSQDSRTEVGRLGAALNGMLARIEDSVREREVSQQRTRRFFADASHELRTPLASLRANAELYQQGALASRQHVDEVMRRIALEAKRMGSLVDDMLRLARLDEHPGRECYPVDVSSLAEECAERARIADPRRSWRSRIGPGLTTAGDEELLRRAIDNILANVRAHTPDGTAVMITAGARDGSVRVEVSDDGPGVAPGALPRIFDRFYRTENRPGEQGSGLGLAIVAAIAASHGGEVSAAVNDPHGLRVTLTVPAATSNELLGDEPGT